MNSGVRGDGKRNARGKAVGVAFPRALRMGLSLDANLDVVGLVAIQVQDHINFAPADQASGHAHVDLIQPGEISLDSGVLHWRYDVADLGADRRKRLEMPQAGAEQDQVDLLSRCAQVEWKR